MPNIVLAQVTECHAKLNQKGRKCQEKYCFIHEVTNSWNIPLLLTWQVDGWSHANMIYDHHVDVHFIGDMFAFK